MKNIFITLFIIGIAAITIGLFWKYDVPQPIFQPEIFKPPQLPQNKFDTKIDQHLAIINQRCDAIKDFNTDIQAKAYRRLTYSLTGNLNFQKPKNCVFTFESLRGRESEIGSNMQEFWFYSRRMSPALYYAKQEDLYRCNLKSPFHPSWIMQGLGLDRLQMPTNAQFETTNDGLRITGTEKGPNNKIVKRVVLTDMKSNIAKGHYLYDSNNAIIASTEIIEFQVLKGLVVPKKVRMVWIEAKERLVLDLTFINTKLNTGIQGSWNRPTRYTPQIDMANDH